MGGGGNWKGRGGGNRGGGGRDNHNDRQRNKDEETFGSMAVNPRDNHARGDSFGERNDRGARGARNGDDGGGNRWARGQALPVPPKKERKSNNADEGLWDDVPKGAQTADADFSAFGAEAEKGTIDKGGMQGGKGDFSTSGTWRRRLTHSKRN
jgi:hypothetical protein